MLSDNEYDTKMMVMCLSTYLRPRTYGQYETVAHQGHKASQLFILTNGTLTTQRIDIRQRSWAVDTKLLYPQSDFGTEAVLFPRGGCKWQQTYKTDGNMCDFLILTTKQFQNALIQVPGAVGCVSKVKRLLTMRRAKRCFQQGDAKKEIIMLLRDYHQREEVKHGLFNESSDELLKEIIQRKTAFIKHLEEATRSDLEANMEDLNAAVIEQLQDIKNGLLSVSVTSMLKKKKKKKRQRHGAGKVSRARANSRPLHTPHGTKSGGFKTGHRSVHSGSSASADGAHHQSASSGSLSYFDAEEQVTAEPAQPLRVQAIKGADKAPVLFTPTSRDPLD